MFLNDVNDTETGGISPNGIYAVKFYALMMPIVVTIDDKIPWRVNAKKSLYARVGGDDKSVWGPLYEKAFAKYHGAYEALSVGNPSTALNTIAGAPGKTFGHSDIT